MTFDAESRACALNRSDAAAAGSAAPGPDEDQVERDRLQELQARAMAAGYALRAIHSGFILQRGTYSLHTGDLINIAHALARIGTRQ